MALNCTQELSGQKPCDALFSALLILQWHMAKKLLLLIFILTVFSLIQCEFLILNSLV